MVQGRTVLEWIVERLGKAARLDEIVAAVGDEVQDAAIIEAAKSIGIEVLAGYPEDVPARLKMTAEAKGADHVVRVNGNFPLVDPASLDDLLADHVVLGADLSLNSHYHGIIYGLGVEILSRAGLGKAASEHLTREQRAIGSSYLCHHPEKYKIHFKPARITAPHFRVSVDYQADINVVEEIIRQGPDPHHESVLEFLNSRPDLTAGQAPSRPGEVSLEKALLFPEKIQALKLNNCVTFDQTYPISVELSLTNRCNHACVWCSDADLRERLGGEMTLAELEPLFADLRRGGTRGVVIEGGGEPTLHPEFREVVKAARRYGLAVGLITNGFKLPYFDMVEDFEWIRVSLDAAGREDYWELKGINGFDRVINNLMTITAKRRHTTLGVGYVVTNRNDDLGRLEQLVLFLRKIGAGYIHFRPVIDHPELASEADLGFLKKYETEAFSVNLGAMTDNRDSGNRGLPCLAHSLSTVITADGGVYLCGRLNMYDSWSPLGNLHESNFYDIWTGQIRREQVKMVSRGDFCRTYCPQCRMTKYNRLLTDMDRLKTRNFI